MRRRIPDRTFVAAWEGFSGAGSAR